MKNSYLLVLVFILIADAQAEDGLKFKYLCGESGNISMHLKKNGSIMVFKKSEKAEGLYKPGTTEEPTQPGYKDYFGELTDPSKNWKRSALHVQQEILQGISSGRIKLDHSEYDCKKFEQ